MGRFKRGRVVTHLHLLFLKENRGDVSGFLSQRIFSIMRRMDGWMGRITLVQLAPKKDQCPDLRVVMMQLEYSKTNMQ